MDEWKKNLYILTVSVFIVMAGMTMIIPFLPLYLQQLGVTDPEQVSIWSGLIFGINFFSAFLVSPLWGRLADRYGRKLMVLRSGFGMAVVMVLMGFATGPWSLFFFRLLNGVISGFNPAAITLVSTNTPKKHVGYALGILQAGSVSGSICGPLFGGMLANVFGYRMIFNFTGLLVGIATIAVYFLVKETFHAPKNEEKTSAKQDFKTIVSVRPIPSIFFVIFLIQFALVGINPMISLFVDELSASANSAFYAGLAVSAMGFANMLASPQLGKLSDKKGAQYVLYASLIGAVLFSIPQVFVIKVWQLIAMRFMVGLCLGGLLPAANALIRRLAPEGMESRTYGFSNSFLFLGNMLGPMMAGIVAAQLGIRSLFIFSATLLLIGLFVMQKNILPSMKKISG